MSNRRRSQELHRRVQQRSHDTVRAGQERQYCHHQAYRWRPDADRDPEEGAEFAVYLKSAGSYDNAKDSERDYLICDENGFAQTKDLTYGRYTVQQTKGWEGRELLKPFDVFVSEMEKLTVI